MTGLVHKPSKEALDKLYPKVNKPKPERKPCTTPYKRWNADEIEFVINSKALGVDNGDIAQALGLTLHQVRNRINRHNLGPEIRKERARIAEKIINGYQNWQKEPAESYRVFVFRI